MNLDNKVKTFEGKKILVVDIETSGLLNMIKSKDDLHIMSVGWKTSRGEWKVKSTDKERDIKKIFEDEDNIIVGHNFIGYDIRALEIMFPNIEYKAQIIDTLPLSQYLFNDRPKHGLESWGVDVGFEKVEIASEEWENLSKEKAIEYLSTVSKERGQVEISQFDAMPDYDSQYHVFRDEENSDETYKYTIEKKIVW